MHYSVQDRSRMHHIHVTIKTIYGFLYHRKNTHSVKKNII